MVTPSIASRWKQCFRLRGERLFLLRGGDAISNADLVGRWELWNKRFQDAGIVPYEAVVLPGPDSPDRIAALFALAEIPAIAVLTTSDDPGAVERAGAVSAAGWSIQTSQKGDPLLRRPAAARPELFRLLEQRGHSGLILFSSGTTGDAKAMLHDLDAMLCGLSLEKVRDDCVLLSAPLDHIAGLDILLRAAANGTRIVIPEKREPDTIGALIARHRVTVLPATPTLLNLMLVQEIPARHDLVSLRLIAYGAEPMPQALLHRLRQAFPGVLLHQKFGTSETGAIRVREIQPDSLFMKFCDPDLEFQVKDGELLLRSPRQILGYLNQPGDAMDEDGWFHTGDQVEAGPDGSLRIVGRLRDRINVGGRKVLPAEVEAVLLTDVDVEDCRVYGESNALSGNWVVADVVLRSSAAPATALSRLRRLAADQLEPHAVPAKVRVVESLPTGRTGKKKRGSA